MKNILISTLAISAFVGVAHAANPLSADQLVKSIQLALKDQASTDPEMFKSISGLRTATVGANAQVTIELKADGMNMSVKYLCVPQGQEIACRQQQ